jgi:uncharacterized SAM-binding protein YcdF (DUF218 family)
MVAFLPLIRRLAAVFLKVLLATAVGAVLLFGAVYVSIRSHFAGTAHLPAQCAVVFGASVYGYDMPGPAIMRRVGKAAQLYRDGQVQRLILSGGVGKGSGRSESEAMVMRNTAIELGVDPSDILLEPSSHSTWENLLFARPLTEGCDTVVGVSDQFHLARIRFLAWRQGWGELQTVPAQERPPAAFERKSVVREMFAMVYYLFFLDVLFPSIQRHASHEISLVLS